MAEAPRMSKEELKERLDDQEVLIIDVRRHKEESETKIKNAHLEDPDRVDAWMNTYPQDKTIVLYCS